jgi:hypothetical protein
VPVGVTEQLVADGTEISEDKKATIKLAEFFAALTLARLNLY